MKTSIIKLFFVFAISTLFFSCDKENTFTATDPLSGLVKLKEGYAIGAATKVELWGKKNFFVGYNNVVVVLYDSLNPTKKITDAHIHFEPLMTMKMGMMTKMHACPVENPAETAVSDVFPGSISFIMGSTGATGYWSLGVSVHNHVTDKEGEVNFDITVDNPATSSLSVFTSQTADSSKYVLAFVQPTTPKVGINDIEFTLNRMETMMSFPAHDSCTFEITPTMPSMGHGSPNNVNPVSIGNGHYKGKVNFTMTGEWKIDVLVKKNGTTISKNAYFNVIL
ncbi:MAG: FixH family protein [Bacteroidales bacterium]